MFNFHNYDNLNHTVAQKEDPRTRTVDNKANSVVNLLFGAANGDVTAIRRFVATTGKYLKVTKQLLVNLSALQNYENELLQGYILDYPLSVVSLPFFSFG